MSPAEISVIIPARNEASGIAAAIDSARVAGASDIVVVDGGSSDDTIAIADRCGARVERSPPGRGTQAAAGGRLAEGSVLLFLHADNRLGKECLRQAVSALDLHPRRWGGAFRQRIESERRAYRLLEWGNQLRVKYRGLPFGDQALFVRREAYERAGGFPDVPLMEDVILAQRLRQQCFPLLLDGPVYVSPRRWEERGIVRQTLKNLSIQAAFALGASPETLVRRYAR